MARVLVVDDSKIMRMTITKFLEGLGHKVIAQAETAWDGIEAYKQYKPDFVTMDITMPIRNGIRDGIEAVSHIIKLDSKAKIIMVTSHGEQDKVIKAIKNGASSYILKPLNPEKIEEVLKKLNL
jgi:two-component system chemotaxis response regulator CheY